MPSFNNYGCSNPSQVAEFVAERLANLLSDGKSALWLLSGGSGGTICIEAGQLLKQKVQDFSKLYVTMSDERYGPVDHPDENMAILLAGGLSLPGATIYRPLSGKPRRETTDDFASWLDQTKSQVDYSLAVLGIGADAHTSGIKPGSVATNSTEAAVDFDGDDFERITTSSHFLKTVDEAVVQAFGESKQDVVKRLKIGEGSEVDQPMLAIRKIKQVTLFSDN